MIIDTHHHFWDPDAADYYWLTDDLRKIRKKFAPADLKPLVERNNVKGTVLVQTRSDIGETREFLTLAAENDFIVGVVGWADLTSSTLGDDLDSLKAGKGGELLVGIRHQVHDEPDENWLVRKDVWRGLAKLQEHDLVYDLLVRPRELPAAIETVRRFSGLRFVLDHIAKPKIAEKEHDPWFSLMKELSEASRNCWVKLSGMVTEADWQHWKTSDIVPYMHKVIELFGVGRCLIGSDWPVCLLVAGYDDAISVALAGLVDLSEDDKARILHQNAQEVYRLNVQP